MSDTHLSPPPYPRRGPQVGAVAYRPAAHSHGGLRDRA